MLPLTIIVMLMHLTPDQGAAAAQDTIGSMDAQSVVVYADGCETSCFTGVPSTSTRSIDELMQFGNAALVSRAAMAGEPMIRGLKGGQIQLTIDGMKIHSACVDKMDPISAYVELNNLRTLEVSSGASDLRYGANLGGAMSFHMRAPAPHSPTTLNADVAYDLNSDLKQVRGRFESSYGDLSAQLTYTYRAANDYLAGGGTRIGHSSFEKHNASASFNYTIDDATSSVSHTVSLSGIADIAPYIGYPGLLMDTRDARGYIGALTWASDWGSGMKTSFKAYMNVVDHTMDDYDRSVDEVMTRSFMPGMYMPMTGTTQTAGFLGEGTMMIGNGILHGTVDLSYVSARADMNMEPIDTSIAAMTMTNIGDARITTLGLNIAYETNLAEAWILRVNGRGDVSPRTLADPASRDILEAYLPGVQLDRTMTAWSATAAITYLVNESTVATLSATSLERLPTHLEMYGFWLYDPQSNFVTIGNADLATERSWGSEMRVEWSTPTIRTRASIYAQVIDRYIAPMPFDDPNSSDSVPAVRYYTNIGQALLAGAEWTFDFTVTDILSIGGMTSYTYGQARDLDDPLPLISPLSLMLRSVFGTSELNMEVRMRSAAGQSRISSVIQPENATKAWITFDAIGTWRLIDNVTLVASLLNIADLRYHEHTSINDVSARGRSFMLTLRTQW